MFAAANKLASDTMNAWCMPAPAPCASVMMHLLFSGTIHSAETLPARSETFRDKDWVFILELLFNINEGSMDIAIARKLFSKQILSFLLNSKWINSMSCPGLQFYL